MLWQDIQSQSRIKDEDSWKRIEQASLDEHKEAQPSTKCNLKNLVKKGANLTTKRWREHFLTCAAEAVAAPTHISSES